MPSNNAMTKEEYMQAQDELLDEALEGDLCQIKVYPAQNRELWLMDECYKTIGLIHRWLFFSAYLKADQLPEERVFSVYTFTMLLMKAVKHKGAEHPRRDFIEFVEEALHKMAERKIVELLILENGFLAACIRSSKPRTDEIKEGMKRYQAAKTMREADLKGKVSLLNRCLDAST